MSAVMDWVKSQLEDYDIEDSELQAATEWLSANKDSLPFAVKEALRKLISNEQHKRL